MPIDLTSGDKDEPVQIESDQTIEEKIEMVEKIIKLIVETENGIQRIWQDIDGERSLLATEDPSEIAKISNWILDNLELFKTTRTIAMIGAGTSVLPRLLSFKLFERFDVYELYQSIIDWNLQNIPTACHFIQGNYEETLLGNYDVIVYDAPQAPNLDLLQSHLNPGGKLIA